MATWLIVLLSVLAGLVVFLCLGVLVGALMWRLWRKADTAMDKRQRGVNKLENQFRKCGVDGWFVDLLEAMVVGDEADIYRRLQDFAMASNLEKEFADKIGLPVATWMLAQDIEFRKKALAEYTTPSGNVSAKKVPSTQVVTPEID